jgi:uncharacterized protein
MAFALRRRALAVVALTGFAAAACSATTEDRQRTAPTGDRATTSPAPGPDLEPEEFRHPLISLRASVIERKYASALPLFRYDRSAPLRIRKEDRSDASFDYVHSEISYESPLGGRVPASLLIPRGRGPFPALVIQHGMPGTRSDVMTEARQYAAAGVVTISIDAPFARRGRAGLAEPITFTTRDRRDQIQLIVDLQRAVDLLLERDDVDANRIAYMGISYGAAMGGLLAGVETRISAYVLAVGDGGIVEHFTGPDDGHAVLSFLEPARRRTWLRAMEPIEPIYFIGRAKPADLLLQSALYDDAVWEADAIRYQRLASEPKEVRWYASGHFLPDEARCDAATWLRARLAFGSAALAPCPD